MLQILFNDVSSAEMAGLPKPLQLEILAEFQQLRPDLSPDKVGEEFGVLVRGGETIFRFRAMDYRIYFQLDAGHLDVLRVLHKNTLADFFFRSSLPSVGEDEALQKNPNFWKLLDPPRPR